MSKSVLRNASKFGWSMIMKSKIRTYKTGGYINST